MSLVLVGRRTPNQWMAMEYRSYKDTDNDHWVKLVQDSKKWAKIPWFVVIIAEPRALSMRDFTRTWTTDPDQVTLSDVEAKAFVRLARRCHPTGRGRWTRSPGGTAVVAEHLLDDTGPSCVMHPSWLTSNVTALARSISDGRSFDRLPILADALEDAGCDSETILSHCRGTGEHVLGCWVVDFLWAAEASKLDDRAKAVRAKYSLPRANERSGK